MSAKLIRTRDEAARKRSEVKALQENLAGGRKYLKEVLQATTNESVKLSTVLPQAEEAVKRLMETLTAEAPRTCALYGSRIASAMSITSACSSTSKELAAAMVTFKELVASVASELKTSSAKHASLSSSQAAAAKRRGEIVDASESRKNALAAATGAGEALRRCVDEVANLSKRYAALEVELGSKQLAIKSSIDATLALETSTSALKESMSAATLSGVGEKAALEASINTALKDVSDAQASKANADAQLISATEAHEKAVAAAAASTTKAAELDKVRLGVSVHPHPALSPQPPFPPPALPPPVRPALSSTRSLRERGMALRSSQPRTPS